MKLTGKIVSLCFFVLALAGIGQAPTPCAK